MSVISSLKAALDHFMSNALVAKSERAFVSAVVPLVIAAISTGRPVTEAVILSILVAGGRAVLAVVEGQYNKPAA